MLVDRSLIPTMRFRKKGKEHLDAVFSVIKMLLLHVDGWAYVF
jgi:hypothetical protein